MLMGVCITMACMQYLLVNHLIYWIFQITPNNILLFHLGVVDSLLCILFCVFSVPFLIRNDELVSVQTFCSFHGILMTLLHPLALWTICGLNCDRYYAIAAPLHYNAIVNSKKVSAINNIYIRILYRLLPIDIDIGRTQCQNFFSSIFFF